MSQTTFDSTKRAGIWEAYENKCFYCGRIITWGELQIDHLIPEKYVADSAGFKALCTDYGLADGFDINGYENLVPAHTSCNLRKTGDLFPKQTMLFYIGLAGKNVEKVENQIASLLNARNRSRVLSKLESMTTNGVLPISTVKAVLGKIEIEKWQVERVKIATPVEFVDAVYDTFDKQGDFSALFHMPLLVGGSKDFGGLELHNDAGNTVEVNTLAEWNDALNKDYYPNSTVMIKMASCFTYLDELIKHLQVATLPKVSFLDDPPIDLTNLDYLSADIIWYPDEEVLAKLNNTQQNKSIQDLVNEGLVTVIVNDPILGLELSFEGFIYNFKEQFRADLNDDGIEDIFVKTSFRADGGTMGGGSTAIFTRLSKKHLIGRLSGS